MCTAMSNGRALLVVVATALLQQASAHVVADMPGNHICMFLFPDSELKCVTPTSTSTERTEIECVKKCIVDPTCYSINFDHRNNQCSVFCTRGPGRRRQLARRSPFLNRQVRHPYGQQNAAATNSVTSSAGSCGNEHELCDFWATKGECNSNRAYMSVKCRQACAMCQSSSGSGSASSSWSGSNTNTNSWSSGSSSTDPTWCRDNNDLCAFWATAGECNKNAAYMKQMCGKSCNACSSGGGGSASASQSAGRVVPAPSLPTQGWQGQQQQQSQSQCTQAQVQRSPLVAHYSKRPRSDCPNQSQTIRATDPPPVATQPPATAAPVVTPAPTAAPTAAPTPAPTAPPTAPPTTQPPPSTTTGCAQQDFIAENMILAGFAFKVTDATSREMCINQCVASKLLFGFECKSGQYFVEQTANNCIINKENRSTQPASYGEAFESDHVDYFEPLCTSAIFNLLLASRGG